MDFNYAPIIKQEFQNTEQQNLNVISEADTNVKVKNEPILDENSSIVTIKNEPLAEAAFPDHLALKTENPFENPVAPAVDSFIIYELETPLGNKQTQNVTPAAGPQYPLPTNTNVQINQIPVNLNEKSREIEMKHAKNLKYSEESTTNSTNSTLRENISLKPLQPQQSLQLSPVKELTLSTTSNTITPAVPILLNTKLRKRNPNVSPVSLLDKRTRYNIEGTISKIAKSETQNKKCEIPIPKAAINTGCKKIINHIINHKRAQRQNELRFYNTKSNCESIVKATTSMANCDSSNLKLSLSNVINPKTDNCKLQLSKAIFAKIASNSVNATKIDSTPIDIETSSSNLSCTTQTENIKDDERLLSPKDSPASATPELRVKCLCRLTDDNSKSLDNSELTDFFKQMFQKTRLLTKKQQRNVKMSLLQAISDAEDAVEQGKCCF